MWTKLLERFPVSLVIYMLTMPLMMIFRLPCSIVVGVETYIRKLQEEKNGRSLSRRVHSVVLVVVVTTHADELLAGASQKHSDISSFGRTETMLIKETSIHSQKSLLPNPHL